jgi:hypothetical protein
MFQYATGRALADAHGCDLKLDISGFDNYKLRIYELGDYRIRASIASEGDIKRFRGSQPVHPLVDRVRKFLRLLPPSIFLEKAFSFDPDVPELPSPCYLEGYWQSERYFSSIRPALLTDFLLASPLDIHNQAILDQMSACNAISLHVRRGDYVTNPAAAQFHGLCSLEYYREAVRYISERVDSPCFFIFSDDTNWVLENIKIDHPLKVVDVNGLDRGICDMVLMRACKHHVIANSSFSWWGAWLNPDDSKIVVAPKRWFKEQNVQTEDLIPNSWVRL